MRCSHKSSSPFKIPHCLFALCSVDVVTSTKWQKRKKAIKLTYKGLLFIFEFWAECQVREREKFRLAGGIAILTFSASFVSTPGPRERDRDLSFFYIFKFLLSQVYNKSTSGNESTATQKVQFQQ